MDHLLERRQLRTQLRQQRRQLTATQQQHASLAIARQLRQQPFFLYARHIAIYLAQDGEPSLHACRHPQATFYLPRLAPLGSGRLLFLRYDQHTRLEKNRFGIDEPRWPGTDRRDQRPAATLDVVLLPLVGFDLHGGRLGMGGGFYDRTFAFQQRAYHCPRLIGVAHDCQQVARLPMASWDIPLDGVITPSGFYPSDRGTTASTS